MATTRWTLMILAVFLSSKMETSTAFPAAESQSLQWSPELMRSLDDWIHQCLSDEMPSRQARRMTYDWTDKDHSSPSDASLDDPTSDGPAAASDSSDAVVSCRGTQDPILKELCEWMVKEQNQDEPLDCRTLLDLVGLDVDDQDYVVRKRGIGAVLLSGKRINRDNRRGIGSEFLGKRALGSEFLGKRSLGSEFLGKRALGSEFLGKRALGSEFLGKRSLGSEFLGKRGLGSEFLGKRSLGSEFLGKRAYRHSGQQGIEQDDVDQLHWNTNRFL